MNRTRFDLNTFLTLAVLALMGWTLEKVSALGELQAAAIVRLSTHDEQIRSLDSRISRLDRIHD